MSELMTLEALDSAIAAARQPMPTSRPFFHEEGFADEDLRQAEWLPARESRFGARGHFCYWRPRKPYSQDLNSAAELLRDLPAGMLQTLNFSVCSWLHTEPMPDKPGFELFVNPCYVAGPGHEALAIAAAWYEHHFKKPVKMEKGIYLVRTYQPEPDKPGMWKWEDIAVGQATTGDGKGEA